MKTSTSMPLAGDAAVLLAHQSLRSVVQIEDGGRGAGAGVIVDARGVIVTNAHVVRGRTTTVTTHGGDQHDGRVEARDDALDLAAIRVDRDDLEAIESGDSKSLRPGQLVLAVGHPLGLNDAVTVGIVSRSPSENDQRQLIASDITLNRGNSGGPLLDAGGRLIGINAMVAGPGLGLAIPIHVVRRFLAQHVEPRPHIGITVQQIGAGLIVTDIQPESPAEAAGLLPGDIILRVAGDEAGSYDVFVDGLMNAGVGGSLRIDLERAGVPVEVISAVTAKA